MKNLKKNIIQVSDIRKTIISFSKNFYYQIIHDKYLTLTEEENLTNYFNASQKSALLNRLDIFKEEFIMTYGYRID